MGSRVCPSTGLVKCTIMIYSMLGLLAMLKHEHDMDPAPFLLQFLLMALS